MKKRIISVMLGTTIGMMSLTGCWGMSVKTVNVEIDGTTMDLETPAQIVDGRTLVPMRDIFEEIGALVKWDGENQIVYARKGSKTVKITINSNQMEIDTGKTDDNGNPIVEIVTLDTPAQIISGKTMVPTRAVTEAFNYDVSWEQATQTVVITSKSHNDDLWKENKGEINLDTMTFTGSGVEIKDNQITVTQGGDYTVTGTVSDGNITVNTQDRVKLRLNNADITTSNGPCIYVENADKFFITVSENTSNSLTAVNSQKGAIYSKDNMEIKGKGQLAINSQAGHGIKASDNLTIEEGIIEIKASQDGINVNDTFKITGGTLNLTCKGDGIASDSIVQIEGGKVNVTTTAEPVQSGTDYEFEASSKGIKAAWMLYVTGGDIAVNSADHGIHCSDVIEVKGGNIVVSSEYGKGISAHGNLTIDGSDTVIDIQKSTEGIESKNICTINDGTISVVATDDGINATGGNAGIGGNMGNRPENNQQPPDGFNGEKPEGVNAPPEFDENMTPPDFNGDMTPSENGDNNQPPQFNGDMTPPEKNNMQRPGRGHNMNEENGDKHFENKGFNKNMTDRNNDSRFKDCLIINGGNIDIYAQDDCLDSNGNLTINGGIIKATRTNGEFLGNFAVLDAEGKVTLSENAQLVFAAAGGVQGNLDIPQNNITLYCTDSHTQSDTITVKDEDGNVVYTYSPKGSYNAVLIASSELQLGKTYSVTVGSESYNVEVDEQSIVVGESKNNQNFHNNRMR